MQEINLLKNQLKDTTATWQRRNRILTTVFVLILIAELTFAGLFFLMSQTTQARKAVIIEANRQTQGKINESQDDLAPARAFQAQLQNLRTLVDRHVYWSGFFDELSAHTFARSRFTRVQANRDGTIFLEGEISSYADLGRMLLGLSTSDKFSDIKLTSAQPAKLESSAIDFSISLKISPQLLQSP